MIFPPPGSPVTGFTLVIDGEHEVVERVLQGIDKVLADFYTEAYVDALAGSAPLRFMLANPFQPPMRGRITFRPGPKHAERPSA